MEGNLFTLSSKKLPKAFIAFLLLVVLTEAASGIVIKKLPSRHCLQRALAMIDKESNNADILILGDSFALTAFYAKDKFFPSGSENKPMSCALSLATNADVTMAGQYFTLKRYLAKNKPPKMVFLISTPFLWDSRLGRLSDNYFFSCFTNKYEIGDILSFTKNPTFLIRMLYYKFLPSAQCSLYLAEFQGKSQDTKRDMLKYLREVILMKIGFAPKRQMRQELSEIGKPQPLVAVPSRPGKAAPAQQAAEETQLKLKVPPARIIDDGEFQSLIGNSRENRGFNLYYFNKISGMLQERGVLFYYVDAAATYSLFRQQGEYFISGRDFIKTLQSKQNNFLYLEDFTPLYFQDEYFYDRNHLNSLGAEYYLRLFNDSVKKLIESTDVNKIHQLAH